jgi:hypothetical protein
MRVEVILILPDSEETMKLHHLLFLALTLGLLLAACAPAAPLSPVDPPQLATSPMEITILPPATEPATVPAATPTLPAQPVPASCQQPGMETFASSRYGYCFAYPGRFTREKSQDGSQIPMLTGPALDQSIEPVRVGLGIQTVPVPAGSELSRLVDIYLAQPQFQDLPWEIQRSPARLSGEEAVVLDGIPGRGSARQVLVLHADALTTFTFHPTDLGPSTPDLEELFEAVTRSFTFMNQSPLPSAAFTPQTITWPQFGQTIRLVYDPSLAPWVEAVTIPAVPSSPQVMPAEAHPANAQFRFVGYQGGRPFQLPYPLQDAQVMVFQTQDFADFASDTPDNFPGQLQALSELLKTGMDPAHCSSPLFGYEQALPFLPGRHARQVFCAQPELIAFQGGRGVRYLVHYSQDDGPVVEGQPFYTFQGLTDDGKLYIAAIFPVQTGVFPTQPPDCPKCSDPTYDPHPDWQAALSEQLDRLNAQPAEKFSPSLAVLDALVRSIQIETP